MDQTTGRIHHYTTADGLTNSEQMVAFADRHGALWFGALQGLVRLVPVSDRQLEPAQVSIRRLSIAGERYPLSPVGTLDVSGIELGPGQGRLEVGFSSPDLAMGRSLRYQYLLEGSSDSWSQPSAERTVNLAHLSPGRYRFLVRAVGADEQTSTPPASVSFRVHPPVWQSWWFPPAVLLLAAAGILRLHRLRIRRALELERLRSRIATDLHDDAGSSLSQVAILCEVARHELEGEQPERVAPILMQMADTAHEVLDSMSDVVWAINPECDRLGDLARRILRFASDTLNAAGVACRFHATRSAQDLRLGIDVRRHIYLLCKEAINNAVRHSGCSEMVIEIGVDRGWMTVTLADDGLGFDTTSRSEGHGLRSMQQRADALGGKLEITSVPRCGACIELRIPLREWWGKRLWRSYRLS